MVDPTFSATPSTPATGQGRFVSLRTKFGVVLSLIIIATCSALSWYFLQTHRDAMVQRLHDIGTILVQNLVSNPRVRFAIVTEDRKTLMEFIESVLTVDDVVYVIIADANGMPLAQRTKGSLTASHPGRRSDRTPLYPSAELLGQPLASLSVTPTMTSLIAHPDQDTATPVLSGSEPFVSSGKQEERLLDFASVVVRPSERDGATASLGLSHAEGMRPAVSGDSEEPRMLGAIHVGLTESLLNRTLLDTIRTSAWLTFAIIVAGIGATVLLTNRVTTPLRSLAHVARRVTSGDLTARTTTSTTNDEIGQLTWLVNNMTESLKERDEAISTNLLTISKQVRQLTTLNQAGATIASTLELEALMTAVLHLLTNNLGFTRVILVLYYPEEGVARLACGAGFSDSLIARLKAASIPIRPGSGLASDIILTGKPVFIRDIDAIAAQVYPPNLTIIKEVGVKSFLMAPLRHQDRPLGYLAGDRGDHPCTQEDLDMLVTVSSHVAVAIDNARAYQELGALTASLEQRVQDRTKELLSANARLQELDKLKSAFVSIVSHELRTPMTSIRGYVDNMLDGLAGPLTEKQRHYLNRVKVNADRLTHMIAELLDLSRIEAGRVELLLSNVDLRQLAGEVVEEFQRVTAERGIRLALRTPSGLPCVPGDRNKLHQVLTNLIGNATKFTPSGGHIDVHIDAPDSGWLRVTITDTGCGIPAEELPRIFEKFFRGSSIPLESRGAGLGLAIVRTLIELHGGMVSVESVPGQGSRFSFALPTEARQSEATPSP